MTNHYLHNLETDKLNIFTGRENWKALPDATRDLIKRNCLFSRTQECWISKARGDRVWWLDHLDKAGFENRGTEGERLSFAEQLEAKQERAEQRAERCEDRATKAERDAAQHFKTFHDRMDAIPFGQPILVGHHSEKRDRNYRAKACAHADKAVEASDKAKYYTGRADTARQTAEASELKNPAFLGRRIKDCETELRRLGWHVEGKFYAYSAASEISEESKQHYEAKKLEIEDRLGFYRAKLAELQEHAGVVVYDREMLKGKTEVRIKGYWHSIVRLNPTTVAVPNSCFPLEADQRKYALKYPYTDVREAQ